MDNFMMGVLVTCATVMFLFNVTDYFSNKEKYELDCKKVTKVDACLIIKDKSNYPLCDIWLENEDAPIEVQWPVEAGMYYCRKKKVEE